MANESRKLIIYHGKCMDGFASAWAARFAFGDDCEFFPANYAQGDKEVDLPDVSGREVYMLDFCVGEGQLSRLIEESSSIRVLDHHATHRDVCGKFECCTFDMDRSGAGLTWDILVGEDRPWLIDYVEDRDLWRFNLESSREVNAAIATVPMTFIDWDNLVNLDRRAVAIRGEGAMAYLDHYVRNMAKEAMIREFMGHADIPVVNAPYLGTSDLVGHLAGDAKFAVGWFQRGDGLYQYSLRSRGDFDVSEVAKSAGGGGHQKAAGFISGDRS